MQEKLNQIRKEATEALQKVTSLKEAEGIFRSLRKRIDASLLQLSQKSQQEKIQAGKEINATKQELFPLFQEKILLLRAGEESQKEHSVFDATIPGKPVIVGSLHPLTQVLRTAKEIFSTMGFSVAEGPEVETEWYNFDALNIPSNHPARDMWDTFWLQSNQQVQSSKFKVQNKTDSSSTLKANTQNSKLLLRTHTSPVQIRYMEAHKPPFRIIAPGTTYRYEATDARHEFQLIQLEGLLIDKKVSVANFVGTIQEFYGQFFQENVSVRLRPSYFPFTEPSFEVDMNCLLCKGNGCSSCGHAGWMEMMGAGMVHPLVLQSAKVDSAKWQGFAFGMGIDRLAMMKYKIPDIRMFRAGDLKFLKQF